MKLRLFPLGYCVLALSTLALLGTPAALTAQNDSNPDVNEVRQYQLTLAKAQEAAAAMQTINQMIAANPSLNAAINSGSSSTSSMTITQQAQTIDSKYPQIAAVISQNGLQSREFIVITGAIINDVGFVGMKKQGMIQSYPPGMITAANATLIENNWDAFQAIAQKMTPPNSN